MNSNTQIRSSQRLRQPRSAGAAHRAGAAVVEFAVIAPLMILLTMGMLEMGRLVMVQQLLVNATREGARLAVLPGASAEEVTEHVEDSLSDAKVYGASVTLNPSSIASAAAGTPITVSVSISAMSVSWIPKPVYSVQKTLTASTTMRKESQ